MVVNKVEHVEQTLHWFSRIYLGGIPATITDDSAFLSFICTLTATDALAGYRYGNTITNNGKRFRAFVAQYFPDGYRTLAVDLWRFRCVVVHSFSTGRFALTHHHSDFHFRQLGEAIILNAEDFYGALLVAAQSYFADVRASEELQKNLIDRLQSEQGGAISVGPLQFPAEEIAGGSMSASGSHIPT